ncbi:unnamed protein product [Tenebrio molitor]|nr:unnamed protein product [Tenebrio molitor]
MKITAVILILGILSAVTACSCHVLPDEDAEDYSNEMIKHSVSKRFRHNSSGNGKWVFS